MYIQPFSMEVDSPEIGCLMDVSTMFYICTYCVFTLWGRSVLINWVETCVQKTQHEVIKIFQALVYIFHSLVLPSSQLVSWCMLCCCVFHKSTPSSTVRCHIFEAPYIPCGVTLILIISPWYWWPGRPLPQHHSAALWKVCSSTPFLLFTMWPK